MWTTRLWEINIDDVGLIGDWDPEDEESADLEVI